MGLFSKPIKSLDDLFLQTLKDIYYAENQIVKALPKMVEKATYLSSAQAVKHYEITRYGTPIAFARRLGREDCAKILEETLAEEKETDRKLTSLAEGQINRKAA